MIFPTLLFYQLFRHVDRDAGRTLLQASIPAELRRQFSVPFSDLVPQQAPRARIRPCELRRCSRWRGGTPYSWRHANASPDGRGFHEGFVACSPSGRRKWSRCGLSIFRGTLVLPVLLGFGYCGFFCKRESLGDATSTLEPPLNPQCRRVLGLTLGYITNPLLPVPFFRRLPG